MGETSTDAPGVPILRVPISLPCQVPVLPGTARTDAPIDERTECCATDAFWMIGRAMICDLHLREILGAEYEDTCGDVELNRSEQGPWEERHRYAHADVGHYPGHPHCTGEPRKPPWCYVRDRTCDPRECIEQQQCTADPGLHDDT